MTIPVLINIGNDHNAIWGSFSHNPEPKSMPCFQRKAQQGTKAFFIAILYFLIIEND